MILHNHRKALQAPCFFFFALEILLAFDLVLYFSLLGMMFYALHVIGLKYSAAELKIGVMKMEQHDGQEQKCGQDAHEGCHSQGQGQEHEQGQEAQHGSYLQQQESKHEHSQEPQDGYHSLEEKHEHEQGQEAREGYCSGIQGQESRENYNSEAEESKPYNNFSEEYDKPVKSNEAGNEQASGQADQKQGSAGSSGKRRRSRWDPKPEEEQETNEGGGSGKKRKSRWDPEEPKMPMLGQIKLPDFKDLTHVPDPKVLLLNAKLLEINKKLKNGDFTLETADGTRSPSPEPIYDNLGIRINSREIRNREKLTALRNDIIAQLIRMNPAFMPPPDYKPHKLCKKLYIPVKEFPGYNFIGLILGPRGNTQKRMEKETGAKILIRGRGSSLKDVRTQLKSDPKLDPSDYDDLHVVVEADDLESLERAASMVEKLLVPLEEGKNAHKRAQLRELAELNGTVREDGVCRLCQQPGHKQNACPNRLSVLQSVVLCHICGDDKHATVACPKVLSQGGKMNDGQSTFKSDALCCICGDDKHPTIACPKGSTESGKVNDRQLTFKSDVLCLICGDGRHPTIACPKGSSEGGKMNDQYYKVLTELGGGALDGFTEKSESILPRLTTQQPGLLSNNMFGKSAIPRLSTQQPSLPSNNMSSESIFSRLTTQQPGLPSNNISWAVEGFGNSTSSYTGAGPGTMGNDGFGSSAAALSQHGCGFSSSHPGLGSDVERKFGKEVDNSYLFVGYLPVTMEDERLFQLFSPFGKIEEAKIIRDRMNGISKGYGFVKFLDVHCAAQAAAYMDGYRLEGKALAVRVAGRSLASATGMGHQGDAYPSHQLQPSKVPTSPGNYASPSWGAVPGRMPSDPYDAFSNSSALRKLQPIGSSVQGGPFKLTLPSSYASYGLYQTPTASAQMSDGIQVLRGAQQLLENAPSTSISRSSAHLSDKLAYFSANLGSNPAYQQYNASSSLQPSIEYSQLSPGPVVGRANPLPWASAPVPSGWQNKCVESEYDALYLR